jgi:hypothetical protein
MSCSTMSTLILEELSDLVFKLDYLFIINDLLIRLVNNLIKNDDGFHGISPCVKQYWLSELISSVVGNRCLKWITYPASSRGITSELPTS